MSILSNILLIFGLLIILVIILIIAFLCILILKNRFKKVVFYDELDVVDLNRYRKETTDVEKFVNANWDIYEKIFKSLPPKELVDFYKNKELISLHNYMVRLKDSTSVTGYQLWEIDEYILPEDGFSMPSFALAENEKTDFPDGAFCFARDLSGNVYYLIPKVDEQYKVIYYEKGSNKSTEVASLSEFLDSSHFCFLKLS
jgi:hypothetical protein